MSFLRQIFEGVFIVKWEEASWPPPAYRLVMVVVTSQFKTEVHPIWCYIDKYGDWRDIFGKSLPEYVTIIYWAEIPEPPSA